MPEEKDGAGYTIIFPRRKAGQSTRGPAQPVIVTMTLLKVTPKPNPGRGCSRTSHPALCHPLRIQE